MTKTITSPNYLIYVRHVTPWAEPRIYPQVIHDHELFNYFLARNPDFRVLAKHELKPDELTLSINELTKRYPSPETNHA